MWAQPSQARYKPVPHPQIGQVLKAFIRYSGLVVDGLYGAVREGDRLLASHVDGTAPPVRNVTGLLPCTTHEAKVQLIRVAAHWGA